MKFANNIIKDLLVDDRLGEGSDRVVYDFLWDPTLVMKIAKDDPSQNITEWQIWEAVQGTKKAEWLAPCVRLTTCGRVLLQKRVEPLRRAEFPKKLPSFIVHDLHISHFGWYEGRIVCCDYGISHWDAKFSGKMRKIRKDSIV